MEVIIKEDEAKDIAKNRGTNTGQHVYMELIDF
jgi:hypothetical protein